MKIVLALSGMELTFFLEEGGQEKLRRKVENLW